MTSEQIPVSTDSSTATQIPPDPQHRVTRKRNRVPLSCGACRHRKLKCNRAQPCDNCLKRGDAAACTYSSPAIRRRTQPPTGDLSTPDEMQGRINRLENLVLSLMTNGAQGVGAAAAAAALSNVRSPGASSENQSQSPTLDGGDDAKESMGEADSELDRVSNNIGMMKVHNDRQFWASEAHWWTILSDIAEVKRWFAEHTKQMEEQYRKFTAIQSGEVGAATALLFRGTAKTDVTKLLAAFPPRTIADKLIIRYFDTDHQTTRILHVPTFRRQYERHWAAPQETSMVWLGLCFCMMSMALQSYHRSGDEPPEYRGKSKDLAATYSDQAAQCLVYADFTQPVKHMVEALCFYFQTEYARSRDAETGLWMLAGIIQRLAMRMGMHRDSAPYSNISPFIGEMRRRTWSFIRVADIQLSFQCGLPNMIRSSDCDAALQANLFDEEFDEDSQELPNSRPMNETTPILFMIAHTRLVYVLGKIQEVSVTLTFPSYEDTMKLDEELRENYVAIPEHFRVHSKEQSSLDSPNLVMERFTLDLTYHKSMCILHRKFLGRARRDARYGYSRKTCINACMEMLEHQATLYKECQPGGRLRTITWSVTTSLTTHDFLLAAMIICLDLYHTAQAEHEGRTTGELYAWALERREPMFAAIERAVAIWETLKDHSLEAYKATVTLTVMLEKLRNHQVLREQLQNNFSFAPSTATQTTDQRARAQGQSQGQGQEVAPEHSAAMTLGMLSAGGMTPDAMSLFDRNYLQNALNPQSVAEQANGLAAGYAGGVDAHANANTPFSNLFGPSFGGFQGLELPTANFGWEGWDTYIQGSTADNTAFSNNFFDQPSFVQEKMAQVQPHAQVQPQFSEADTAAFLQAAAAQGEKASAGVV